MHWQPVCKLPMYIALLSTLFKGRHTGSLLGWISNTIVSHFEEKARSMSVFNQSLHHLSLHLVFYPCFTGLSEFYLYGASLLWKAKVCRMFHLHLLNKVMTHFLWMFANYVDSGLDLTCRSIFLLCSPFLENILSFIITYSFVRH